MSRHMTFWFDASACSGCKACQVACKDRHGLEVGRLWRRVSEVAGGTWRQAGAAWHQDVFAYYLSISCNHCGRPICLEGCPARAITRREDGVVLIEPERCLGCGYCSWVCPYSAPQYHAEQGVMSKCTFCHEDMDAGLEPACVAACPVRALDAGDAGELAERHGLAAQAAEVPPLPAASLTEPALQLAPHAQAARSREPDTELTPRPPRGLREWSLVVFTLLSQTAAGLVIFTAGLRVWLAGAADASRHDPILLPLAGCLMLLALLVSSLHLGRPGRAVRALANLRSSWLTREILLALILLATMVLAWWPAWVLAQWLSLPAAVAFLTGMAGVYLQRTVPVWSTWRTPLAFCTTAIVLGVLGGLAILIGLGRLVVAAPVAGFVWAAFVLALVHQLRQRRTFYSDYERLGV
jgi:anaerobic dimethyl sulfoxide reductase subunit B (iron-sulfur subunit)